MDPHATTTFWNSTKNSSFDKIYEEEAAHSVFFSTYSPKSPLFSNYTSDYGISYGWLKFGLHGIGIIFLTILGVIGNILSMIVLSSKRMKCSTSCLLLYLAVCDIVTLLTASLFLGIPTLLTYYPTKESSFNLNENLAAFGDIVPSAELFVIFFIAFAGSTFFTMALTLERYLVICKPLWARAWCTWERANRVSMGIILFSFAFHSPKWWDYYYVEERICNDLILTRPVPTPFRANKIYNAWTLLSYIIVQFLAPIILFITFNLLIYREMRRANGLRKSMSASQKQEISLTRMLFGVVAVFLICNIFPALYIGYKSYKGAAEFKKNYVPEPELILPFTVIINSSVNFIIYCATGEKFRQVFDSIFFSTHFDSVHNRWRIISPQNSLVHSNNFEM